MAMSNYGHYLPSDRRSIYNRDIMLYMLKLMRIIGVRTQEARAIRRSNIIFDNIEVMNDKGEYEPIEVVFIKVKRSIGASGTERNVEVNTKSPYSVRGIPITGDNIKLVKEILNYSKYELLFANYDGNPFSTDEFSDYLGRVSKACGIKVYSLLMRKAFASDLYSQNVNPAVTKRLIGHKEENMSLNAYASASKNELIMATLNREYKKMS